MNLRYATPESFPSIGTRNPRATTRPPLKPSRDCNYHILMIVAGMHRALGRALCERQLLLGALHHAYGADSRMSRNPQREKALTAFASGIYSQIAHREALMFNANSALGAPRRARLRSARQDSKS